MQRLRLLLALAACLVTISLVQAGSAALSLATAVGTVDKAEKDAMTLHARGADGKFGKKLVLKITGTSKLTLVSQEKRGGKLVPVQRDVDAKDLEMGQHAAVVYTLGTAETILLSAVVQKAGAAK